MLSTVSVFDRYFFTQLLCCVRVSLGVRRYSERALWRGDAGLQEHGDRGGRERGGRGKRRGTSRLKKQAAASKSGPALSRRRSEPCELARTAAGRC